MSCDCGCTHTIVDGMHLCVYQEIWSRLQNHTSYKVLAGTNLNVRVSTRKISHNSCFWIIQTVNSTTAFFPYCSCFHLVVEDSLRRGQEGKAPAVCSQEDLEHRWNCESPKSKVGRTERTKNAHYPLLDLYLISEKSIWKNQVRQTGFLVYFELDFYCLCRLQKSIPK